MKEKIKRYVDIENGMEVLIFVNQFDNIVVRLRDIDAQENVTLITPRDQTVLGASMIATKMMQNQNFMEVAS